MDTAVLRKRNEVKERERERGRVLRDLPSIEIHSIWTQIGHEALSQFKCSRTLVAHHCMVTWHKLGEHSLSADANRVLQF